MKVRVTKLYLLDCIFGVKIGQVCDVEKNHDTWYKVKLSNGETACMHKDQVEIVEGGAMDRYKLLLDKGFKPIYYNKNLGEYTLKSRLNYRKNLTLERYEGIILSIIDKLGFDKYFELKDADSIWIECSEDLSIDGIFFTNDSGEISVIDITDKLDEILKSLPNEFEYYERLE